ncbi:MAG: hypothetical protein ABJQ08_18470, partial [Paracoccaceae bacterium]
MATIFRTGSGGGPGVLVTLNSGDDFILADGAQIYSDDDSVIEGTGSNNIFLSPNSGVIGFSPINSAAAVRLGTTSGGSNLFVAENASIWSPGIAVFAENGFSTVTNGGIISGLSSGIEMQGSFNGVVNTGDILSASSIGVRVWANGTIENSGTISGTSFGAVTRDGHGEIINSGTISGETAIFMEGDNTGPSSKLKNSGTISGDRSGVFVSTDSIEIVNTGTISAAAEAIELAVSNSVLLSTLDNSGTITASGNAYSGTNGVDQIHNSGNIHGNVRTFNGVDTINSSGQILGDVDLGDGADVYRLTGTGQTSGVVTAGAGDDVVQGGMYEDYINGGDGEDRMRGQGGDDSLT